MKLEYIDKVTSKYGRFALSDYLNQTSRSYATFLIDYSRKDIIYSDGLSDTDLKENSTIGLNLNSKEIYALYGQRNCKSSANPVEVIMIEKDLWESDDEELKELLIFHEVCHLLEKRGYYKYLNFILSDLELKVGEKLAEIADRMNDMTGSWGKDEDHNKMFGAILFHFLQQFDRENCSQLLARSMIKNFGDDYTLTFKEVV